jgi:two-component system cell cycle sensor histidine kinase PleC
MFAYLRIFFIISLLTALALAGAGGFYYRTLSAERVTQLAQATNSSIAQAYINAVWQQYRQVVVPLAAGDLSQLGSNPQVIELAQNTARYFQQVPLTRVNIYTAKGALLMATSISNDRKLPDNVTSPNESFATAQLKSSTPRSLLLHGVALKNGQPASLVQTMFPILVTGADNAVTAEGFIEVIHDVTATWQEMMQFSYYAMGAVAGLFFLLLLIIMIAAKRAENIIARQHEANLELTAAAAAAHEENQEKSQFLANISHELRTPLNAIIGFSDIIKNEIINPMNNETYTRYITDINSAGVHLLSLINDILDYSKAEAGKLEMEVSEINASKLVQNCMRLVQPRAEAGNVTLADRMPKEQFVIVNDGKKFKQILLNLLSNAVKFTPAGGEVSVTAWSNVTEDTVSFEVQDTGIGIAPKDISRAMSAFGQVDNSLQRRYEGTGLGLPLTKKFVELMGGKFVITSEVNVGTKITITVPRELKPHHGVIIKQAS